MSAPRVMVVEDERVVAFNLCQTLKRLGYNTDSVASSGHAALELIAERPPDIVLMDIHIDGDIDGIETVSRIPSGLLVPVIYLTAFAEESTLERARATNPYGYLLKPFSERELNAMIRMALSRRASDIAVREREEKLRMALAAAELSSWEVDPTTGHILYKDHIGWSSDASPKTVAQSFRDFLPSVHADDRDAVRAAFDCISGTNEPCEIEFRKSSLNGQQRWYRVVGRAVYAPNDRRRRIVGVSRDVTSAKLASQERQASEQSYRDLISTIDGIVWEADLRKHALTYVSDSAERVLGYTSKRWMTEPQFWEKHLHPEDAERAIAEYRKGVRTRQSYESTYRMIANDGEVVWIHEVVSMVANGDQRTVLRGVMVDITSLKKAEQENASTALRLAESEQRLAAILDTAAVGIVTVDECHRIISFNIEAERIFGYRAHEMLGQELDRLVPDLFAVANQDRDWRLVAGSAAGGRVVPLTTTVSTVTVAGRTTMTAIMRDMTEAQKAEETMRALLEERERDVIRGEAANRAKANFLAVMSHELRTPLNAIIGFSDVISREIMGPIGNDAYRRYADDIHHSGNLLLTIVNNILDLSRIDARKDELDIVELALDEAWKPIASTLLANAAAKDIALNALAPKCDRKFAADRNAISHILLNLVSNAIKFTGAGGSIEVGQEEGDGGSGEFAIYVRDTGRGIPPDKLTEVMKPFVQVSDCYVRDAGGIGLGLAICKSLAEAMGGRIVIESQLGKGTIVRVFLPACGKSSKAPAERRSGSRSSRSRKERRSAAPRAAE